MKGDFYEGGTRVPGLLEWPARFPEPVATSLRASTSDLLPTVAALAGASLPDCPLDGIDLMPLLAAGQTERPSPLFFWGYDIRSFLARKPEPYLAPELQKGTTPLVKIAKGIATRNFQNYRHPGIVEADHGGARSIIEGRYKLLVQDRKDGGPQRELFDLEADPGETRDLAKEHAELAESLAGKLRAWQDSVLHSLGEGDVAK